MVKKQGRDKAAKPAGGAKGEGLGGKAVAVVLVVVLVLAGGAYAAAGAAAGDRVPRGTTVAGVEIGGLEPADAERTLQRELRDRADAPIAVSVEAEDGERTAEVDPAEAGIALDAEATVDQAGGASSWAPDRLWDYWTGGDEVDPVLDVDEQALDEALDALAEEVGTAPVDATVRFAGGGVRTTPAETGRTVDPEAARDAVLAAYLSEDPAVTLELTDVEPDVTDADAERAVADFANPALAGPVTLTFGDSPVTLRPEQYASALSLEPVDGELEPGVDTDVVLDLVADATAAGKPVDATVALVDGKPQVVPAKPGVDYEPEAVEEVFLDLLTRPEGRRTGEVEASVVEPEFTTKEARQLKIREQVSTFTTYYPHAEYRNVNIGRAAELVDGTVLKPGDVFSMNDIVGERTVENGFTEGFVISDGILREDLGGGVSQMATTLFNAMYFAGLEDVEHRPHSFYIDRYPVGREATVVWGALDLRFRNDTPYGVLVSARVTPSTPSSQGVVTVTMYSTTYWDISSRTSERYDYVAPETRYLQTDDCYAYTGSSGFSVDVFRTFRRAGEQEVVRTEKFHTDYTASDSVVCGPPPGSGGGGGGNG